METTHNRVTKIQELVPVTQWSHCPGKDNPADMPSCSISPRELQSSLSWLHGPQWLPAMSLPHQLDRPNECVVEMKGKGCAISHSLVISAAIPTIEMVINCQRFRRLHKLLRVTVYVQKFVLITA